MQIPYRETGERTQQMEAAFAARERAERLRERAAEELFNADRLARRKANQKAGVQSLAGLLGAR